jgi:hypothetical protein
MTVEEDERTPLLPVNETGSVLGELWLKSRLQKPSDLEESEQKGISPNAFRPLTMYHFRLSLQLARLSWPFFFSMVWQMNRWAVIGTVLGSIISGFLPPVMAWTSAKLLNEVQVSLTTGSYRLDKIELYASLTIGLALFSLCFHYLDYLSRGRLRRDMMHTASRVLLQSKLNLDIGALLDPYRRDIIEGRCSQGDTTGIKKSMQRQRFSRETGQQSTAGAVIITRYVYCHRSGMLKSLA